MTEPAWVERWSYNVAALATLPTPEAPGRPACMTTPVPTWRRVYRQRVPRRRPHGCCWYHGGDWHHVNATAIRLVHKAKTLGATGEDIGDHALDSAVAAGITGWDLDALASLLVIEPIRIDSDDDPASQWYDNGRHRIIAMLDAGVRHTILVRVELLDSTTGLPPRH
ncbi:hypothetical protein ND748_20340 [Frankia sp. AiPs1]|uniref:hypothetical protein n=1 Tax=Frankia sp. AiPs1 TaxID=573493 RepID=UPI0020443525|nr:hypothetical protein [Frankia sp. AiPs1]MCM3924008.1 hypothetical protein [Frankia sp. AiPs1]